MFDSPSETPTRPDDIDGLVRDMEQSTAEAVQQARAHVRHSLRARVVIEPASMSHRGPTGIDGVTGDVSSGGAQVLTTTPLRINDVYLVTFDRNVIDVPPAYAVCVRARIVRSDAFEAGLRFLAPIELPLTHDRSDRSLL